MDPISAFYIGGNNNGEMQMRVVDQPTEDSAKSVIATEDMDVEEFRASCATTMESSAISLLIVGHLEVERTKTADRQSGKR